ncbi:hypothetical protein AQUCO_02500282v1 [Aquilegia coerulea]|uniref:Cyclic nucleotide-binding domain-containing protein n=1 Tax=Aquilegia coerulea TaxID=218851 RepID=A0A2G5DAC5_AQUCA|nr:hypothetical protein AQUCO_02500282v1 [Aquilegia coerulea]
MNSINNDPSSAPKFRLIGRTTSQFFIKNNINNINNNRNDSWRYQILDPSGKFLTIWNRVFLSTCFVALFVDPLYFYLPNIRIHQGCIQIDQNLLLTVTILRTLADVFYLVHIVFKFRTAFFSKSSRVVGRGELIKDPQEIKMRYLKSDFIIDFAAMLPLPQIVNWVIIPKLANRTAEHANNALSLIVLIQYVPRLFLIFPLNRRIVKNTGVVTKTAWAGAAYNLLLYMLASHVLGAAWYLLSIQRQYYCWHEACVKEQNGVPCDLKFLDCAILDDDTGKVQRAAWLDVTQVFRQCNATNDDISFKYGIYEDALTSEVHSAVFPEKYLYCLWWGLKNLSSYGQDLATSSYIPETLFCVLICIGGLVLFSHLIGNIQTYLQSMTVRVEEWRVKRRDAEEWMRHRQLPHDLQERVRRFEQYKWLATRGVDENNILRSLPLDLRRDIQRHLCLGLVRRVPFFAQMDDQLLDAICERLVSSLSTEDTYIVREGDPVNEMIFIIRGQLESSTTNGGRSGFFNSIILRAGDFCGEELLTWALMPNPSQNFPTSTRTVRAQGEVEAFALRAEDLKYVANQFKRLHSKKLQHAFRYYSHQWRTWGGCFIQAAWRRYKKKKLARELAIHEGLYYNLVPNQDEAMEGDEDTDAYSSAVENTSSGQHFGATVLASKFAANTRRGVSQKKKLIDLDGSSLEMPKFLKPDDPDFSETDLG